MPTYHYVLSGVRVSLPFALPTVVPDDGTAFFANLPVHSDHVSLPPVSATAIGLGIWVGDKTVWFVNSRVGRFCLAQTGLTIDLVPKVDLLLVEQFMVGHVLGAVLHQAAIFPLHASCCVIHGHHTIAFAARRGVGKSTLAAALHERGCSMLADDLMPIRDGPGGRPLAWPGPRRQRLTPATLAALGLSSDSGLKLPYGDKLLVTSPKLSWQTGPVALTAVVELVRDEEVVTTRLGAAAAAAVLHQHTFRRRLLAPLGQKLANALQCTTLAGQLPVFRLSRPDDLSRLDTLTDAVFSLVAGFENCR